MLCTISDYYHLTLICNAICVWTFSFQVSLGNPNKLLRADLNANKLPAGCHSVMGQGRTMPDPDQDLKMWGLTMKIVFFAQLHTFSRVLSLLKLLPILWSTSTALFFVPGLTALWFHMASPRTQASQIQADTLFSTMSTLFMIRAKFGCDTSWRSNSTTNS